MLAWSNPLSESQLIKTPVLKLKHGNKVKRLPILPKSYDELHNFILTHVPPFNEGTDFTLHYFDDERECITISDQVDYESFLIFNAEEGIKIPKLLICSDEDDPLTYEAANSELNRTMCVSYIGDSEFERNWLRES